MSKQIVNAVAGFAKSEIASQAKISITDAAFAYAAIQHLEDVLKARKEKLREILLNHAEKHGIPVGEKGALEVTVAGTKIVRERKTASAPDESKLKVMVKEKGLPLEEAFDEVTVYELNPSKVQYLVETGKLDGAEVDALKRVTVSLKVSASAATKKALEEAAPIPE